jgi:hypothetical protein
MANIPRCLLVLLLLVLGGLRLGAAEQPPDIERLKGGPAAEQTAGGVDQPLIAPLRPRHDLTRLRGVSPLVGALLLVIAAVPLFAGWRLLRFALALLVGCFLALWTWQYGMPWLQHVFSGDGTALQPLLAVAACVAFVAGFALGWIMYQLQLAVAGALLGVMVLSLPGLYLDLTWLTMLLMAVGAVLGFVLGWVAAPYWAAVQTSILGGFLVVQGTAVLVQQWNDDERMRLIAYGSGIAAAVVGLVAQALWIARHHGPKAPSGGGRPAMA